MRRSIPHRLIVAVALIFTVLSTLPAFAGSQYGPQTSYSSSQIQDAVAASSGYNSTMMSNAGSLGTFESSGNAGIYNGKCCTGVFQLNQSNLAAIGLTPSQYANMPLQQQAQAWVNLTNQSASSPAVQQLQQMAQNGQSFDGHTVDSGMILACIQLGTGNCQKMVNSGSCSGFSDSNGTTICDMAAKINGGSSGSASSASTPPSSSSTTPASGGGGSTSDKLGLPTDAPNECWACDAIISAFNLQDKLVQNFANNGGGTSWTIPKLLPLFTMIFAIVFVFQIGRNVVFWYMHYSPPREIFGMFIRFVIVITILQSSALTTNIIQPYLLEPAIGAGGQIGAKIGGLAASAFGTTIGSSSCTTKAQIALTDSVMSQGVQAVVDLVCQVHQQSSALLTGPAAVMQCPTTSSSSTPLSIISAIVMKIYSLAVPFMIAVGLITMAMQIVEIAVRIGVYSILFPFFLYTWVYKRTSAIFHNMLKGYLFVFFKFAFLGPFLGAAVALFAIAATYASGLPTNCLTDPSSNSSAFAALITSVLATIAVSAFASQLMTAATNVASKITGYSYANLGAASAGAQAMALGASGAMQGTTIAAKGIEAMTQMGANMSSPQFKALAVALGLGSAAYVANKAEFQSTSPLPKGQTPDTAEEKIAKLNH